MCRDRGVVCEFGPEAYCQCSRELSREVRRYCNCVREDKGYQPASMPRNAL
jgi:hypothetical protein